MKLHGEYKNALLELIRKLNEFQPLDKNKTLVHPLAYKPYTEFEILEYYFDPHIENLSRIRIKFKPKGSSVSFWTVKFEDVIISN